MKSTLLKILFKQFIIFGTIRKTRKLREFTVNSSYTKSQIIWIKVISLQHTSKMLYAYGLLCHPFSVLPSFSQAPNAQWRIFPFWSFSKLPSSHMTPSPTTAPKRGSADHSNQKTAYKMLIQVRSYFEIKMLKDLSCNKLDVWNGCNYKINYI